MPRKRPGAYKPVGRVEVWLWGRMIGAVALDPAYGYYAFRYTPEFQAAGIEPAPLHMPVGEDRTYLFTDLPEATYRRLPAMLSDALPDDFGNALIDRYMAERGVPHGAITSLDRLAYMSNRAMGALQFKHEVRAAIRDWPVFAREAGVAESQVQTIAALLLPLDRD